MAAHSLAHNGDHFVSLLIDDRDLSPVVLSPAAYEAQLRTGRFENEYLPYLFCAPRGKLSGRFDGTLRTRRYNACSAREQLAGGFFLGDFGHRLYPHGDGTARPTQAIYASALSADGAWLFVIIARDDDPVKIAANADVDPLPLAWAWRLDEEEPRVPLKVDNYIGLLQWPGSKRPLPRPDVALVLRSDLESPPSGAMFCVAISPDSRRCLIGCNSGDCLVWDLPTAAPAPACGSAARSSASPLPDAVLRGHLARVTGCSFSQPSAACPPLMLTASIDGEARLWSASRKSAGHQEAHACLAVLRLDGTSSAPPPPPPSGPVLTRSSRPGEAQLPWQAAAEAAAKGIGSATVGLSPTGRHALLSVNRCSALFELAWGGAATVAGKGVVAPSSDSPGPGPPVVRCLAALDKRAQWVAAGPTSFSPDGRFVLTAEDGLLSALVLPDASASTSGSLATSPVGPAPLTVLTSHPMAETPSCVAWSPLPDRIVVGTSRGRIHGLQATNLAKA